MTKKEGKTLQLKDTVRLTRHTSHSLRISKEQGTLNNLSRYITGFTSTDCAVTSLSGENYVLSTELIGPMADHIGIAPGCDPNYFNPQFPGSLGGGPYASFRRCLYGKEIADYGYEYA